MTAFGRTAAAVVVAAGLFGYIYFVESKKDPKTDLPGASSTPKEKIFAGFDKLKAKSLTLKKRNGDLVQAEKRGETWTLVSAKEVAADPGEIGTLLDALQNLETDEIVGESVTDLAAFGLTEPKVAVSVVAEGAPKPFEFELGDGVPAGSGLFARVPGKPRIFTVSSTLENTLSKSAFDLRDRNLVKFKKDAVRSVEVIEKGKSGYRLVRGEAGEDEWRVEAPVRTRAGRWTVDGLLGLMENLRMESIASEEVAPKDLAKYGLDSGARRVVLGLAESKSITLEIGEKTEDGKYHAREAGSRLVALIASGLADDLDKGFKNLRSNRLLDVATYEVNGFDVTSAGTKKTFSKFAAKGKDGVDQIVWKGAPPAKDAPEEKASSALFSIGGIEVAEFIDAPQGLATYGLDVPALRVALRFEGGKKEDWFEVGIKGDAAFGRRRDDAAVLKLDKAKIETLVGNFATLGS